MSAISFARFGRLTCLIPEDVGGDETKMNFYVDSDLWDSTAGRALDQVNKQLEGFLRVEGLTVTPQLPNKGGVLVWKPPRSRLPVKEREWFDIEWTIPFAKAIRVKLIDRDSGLLDGDDKLGTEKVTADSNGKGPRSLVWKGGSRLMASRFHYKLTYVTSVIPDDLFRDVVSAGAAGFSGSRQIKELAQRLDF